MDFNFTEEEQDFRRSVRDWVNDKYPKTKVNELERHRGPRRHELPASSTSRTWPKPASSASGSTRSFGGQGGGATDAGDPDGRAGAQPGRPDLGVGYLVVLRQVDPKFAQPGDPRRVRPADGRRREEGGDRDHRAQRRHRPARRDDHPRQADGRRLSDQRGQDLVDDGPRLGLPAAAGQDLRRREVLGTARRCSWCRPTRRAWSRTPIPSSGCAAWPRARSSSTTLSCPTRT